MSDSTPVPAGSLAPSSPAITPTPPAAPTVDLVDVCAMLGNPLRWEMIKLLAGGAALSASEIATRLGRDFDGVSKHLKLMRDVKVLLWKRGEDQRTALYYLPETVRAKPGELDFECCWFQLSPVQQK